MEQVMTEVPRDERHAAKASDTKSRQSKTKRPRWVRHRDRFEKLQEDERPPDDFQVVGKAESGAALWLASKFALPDWSETAFTFVMDEKEEAKFLEPFGYKAPEFVFGLLREVAKVGKLGRYADQSLIEFYFSAIAGMKPRDATETMLAAQMAALQPLILRTCNRLAHMEDLTEAEIVGRTLSKLSRTFSNLATTFDRHRMVGEHRISMQQISVSLTSAADQKIPRSSCDVDELARQAPRQIPRLDTVQMPPLQEPLDANNDAILAKPARQKKNGRQAPA